MELLKIPFYCIIRIITSSSSYNILAFFEGDKVQYLNNFYKITKQVVLKCSI